MGKGKHGWQPGDKPQTHPKWQEQVELEMEMQQAGFEAYRSRLGDARDHEEMTRVSTYRHIMEDLLGDMGRGLHAWLQGSAKEQRNGGGVAIAYQILKDFDPYLAAYVTTRTVVDLLGTTDNFTDKPKVMGLITVAHAIGTTLEHQARMEAWLDEGKDAKKVFVGIQRKLKAQKATTGHKQRVNINRFNVLMREDLEWANWPADTRRRVGLKLLEILCRTTGHFSIVEDPNHKMRGKKVVPQKVLMVGQDLMKHLIEEVRQDALRQPFYMPTVMPPKRWTGMRSGGYYTPMARTPGLVRFKADNEEIRGLAMDEFDALDMPRVLEAVNKVQEVPWTINKAVHDVFVEAWDRDLGIGKLIRREHKTLPPRPPGMQRLDIPAGPDRKAAELAWAQEHPEEVRAWRRAAAQVYGDNARQASNGRAVTSTLFLADKFRDKEFYFPHMLDFRGRMYPIPSYLQPQGGDLARGLLQFAWGWPITEDNGGVGWLAIHLANVWGMDKVSFEERIEWVGERNDLWERIAAAPLKNLEWCGPGRKDAWQTLAAIFEWVRFQKHGFGMVSFLPIRVDGTCNGIQHLSAMMRDPVGANSVNLLPAESPRDIYAEVAAKLQARLEAIRAAGGSQGHKADVWLRMFPERKIPRSFTKNPVMVLPYGGTKESYYGSIQKWLADEGEAKGEPFPEGFNKHGVPWMVGHLWEAVNAVVVQAKICMEWFKKVAKKVALTGQPIFWTTRTGFHVRHFYGKAEVRTLRTLIDGRSVDFTISERGKELAKREQLQGISPNFVHSQDASVNMETILRFMHGGGHKHPFTSIHDAFGTTAGRMWVLFGHIREAFIEVHSEDVMVEFRKKCVSMMLGHYMATKPEWGLEKSWEQAEKDIEAVPDRGELNLEEVRNADYFFA